jgi:hypothetical protein
MHVDLGRHSTLLAIGAIATVHRILSCRSLLKHIPEMSESWIRDVRKHQPDWGKSRRRWVCGQDRTCNATRITCRCCEEYGADQQPRNNWKARYGTVGYLKLARLQYTAHFRHDGVSMALTIFEAFKSVMRLSSNDGSGRCKC